MRLAYWATLGVLICALTITADALEVEEDIVALQSGAKVGPPHSILILPSEKTHSLMLTRKFILQVDPTKCIAALNAWRAGSKSWVMLNAAKATAKAAAEKDDPNGLDALAAANTQVETLTKTYESSAEGSIYTRAKQSCVKTGSLSYDIFSVASATKKKPPTAKDFHCESHQEELEASIDVLRRMVHAGSQAAAYEINELKSLRDGRGALSTAQAAQRRAEADVAKDGVALDSIERGARKRTANAMKENTPSARGEVHVHCTHHPLFMICFKYTVF